MLWITSLKLKGFGRFPEAHFAFKPGMNLIHGRNEAGKSTIMAAIAGVIFGIKKDKDRFVPWDGPARCEAEASFAWQGRELVIARDFMGDRVKAVERAGGKTVWQFEGKVSPSGRSSEREEYLRKIEEIWGFAEADIFRNSVHIGQRDLKIEGDGALTAKIKQLLTGFSDIDYDAVRESLEKELFDLTKKPGGRARDRELEEVRARLVDLATLWREASRALGEVKKQEAVVDEIKKELDAGRSDLEKGRLYLERVRKCHELIAEEKGLKDEYVRVQADLEKVDGLWARKSALEKEIAGLGDLVALPGEFPNRFHSYRESREKLAGLESERRALQESPSAASGTGMAVTTIIILGCWIPAVISWFNFRNFLAPMAGVALVVSALLMVRMLKREQARKSDEAHLRGRIDGITSEIVKLRGAMADFEEEHAGFAEDLAERGGEKLSIGLEKLQALKADIALVESALGVLSSRDELRERSAGLTRELAVIRDRVETITGKGFPVLTPQEYAAAEEKMRRLEGDLKEKERDYLGKEQELAVLRRGMQDLESIEDEGEELKQRETRLVKRIAALRLAIELLAETLDEYRATYLERFSQEINGKLYSLTSGRHREALLDDAFNLAIGSDGRLRPVESYSCGVQDQTYLASRLALGEILSRGRKLPFLLDDPLVNFDEERKNSAVATLGQLARGHQVLLFVHDDRYLRMKGSEAWNRIKLEDMEALHGQLHLL